MIDKYFWCEGALRESNPAGSESTVVLKCDPDPICHLSATNADMIIRALNALPREGEGS